MYREIIQKEIYSDESLLDGSIGEYRWDIERVCIKYGIALLEKHTLNIPNQAAHAKSEILKEIEQLRQKLNISFFYQ